MRFQLRTLLGFIVVVGVILTAFVNPNRNSLLLVSTLASIVWLASLAVAIGARNKVRIQCGSFALLAAFYYLGAVVHNLPFSQSEALVLQAIERSTTFTDPRQASDGTRVFLHEDGRYTILRSGTGNNYEQTTREEVEKLGLSRYVLSAQNTPSFDSMADIYRNTIAMLVGAFGFVLSGYAYSKRVESDRCDPDKN